MLTIPSNVTGRNREEWQLADHLITNVIGKASGASELECHLNYPQDVYFIGNLRPKSDDDDSLARADLMQKLSPSAFGAEFKITPADNNIELQIDLTWSCYYRVFPTYTQQRTWSTRLEGDSDNAGSENTTNASAGNEQEGSSTSANRPQFRQSREDLFIRFKKVRCSASGKIAISRNANNEWQVNNSDIERAIQDEINRVIRVIDSDDEKIKLSSSNQFFTIPQESIVDQEAYARFTQTLKVPLSFKWSWEIAHEIYQNDSQSGEIIVLIQFVNSTRIQEPEKAFESYFFDTKATFQIAKGDVKPFELELAPKSFRYNRELWGRGFNCGLEKQDDRYITTHTPIHTQYRYKTQNTPEALFSILSIDPIPILERIAESMSLYINEWAVQREEYIRSYGSYWSIQFASDYDHDQQTFEQEIARFRQGLDLIKSDEDILLAFKLSNETFRRAGLDREGAIQKDRWRLFQIVFFVSQIQGIAALNPKYKEQFSSDRDFVDIIYFPTGGGKTEAYLASLVFHCFYDRLRGKKVGVTSWIRFPLRLLTLQQTQRLADTIGIAELVRQAQSEKRLSDASVDPFAVGYYVGGGDGSTPNEIKGPINGRSDVLWSIATDASERQKWKRVVTCPSCKTNSVSVEFDESLVRVLHKCSNTSCSFKNGIIPVFVIDNEIYRYLPTVMVGTIDKLAGIGNTRKLSIVFGKVDGYCKVHGYYNSICCQKECTDKSRLVPRTIEGLSGPTLFIQDELHLLKEGLGTFDSHYETFTQYLLNENKITPKIIASSATIERYERQVEHLYGREKRLARVFPGFGPTLGASFYAQTENYPQRIFVGIIPHNKTIFNTILEIIEYYHRITQTLAKATGNPFGGSTPVPSTAWNQLIDLYYTSLTYFMASRDLDQTKTDIESHINGSKFSNEGLNPIETKELTGSTSTNDVTTILDQLQKYHSPTDSHEAVLATNMISHGVDVDRFNAMIFYGMPRQNAEYIQSSSRVGRSHVGIVFNCLHPIRERDQSHYSYFTKYHEFLGQLVEPVAINRWSAYGIDKTLPGLFMGTILQILSNKEVGGNRNSYYMLNKISQMYQSGQINKDEIKTILKNAFNANIASDPRNSEIARKIDRAVDYYFDNISNAGSTASFVSNVLHPRPMRSLRDIDDPIEISLGRLGEQWLNIN